MAELLTRHRRQDWGGLQGGSGDGSRIRDDFTVLPPESRWDRSIRCELRDGDVAPWDGGLEVAQVQAGVHHSPGQDRWISLWLLYDQVAAYSNLDFHFSHEVHSQGSQGSAPWAENVTTTQRQLRRTPSSGFDHVWPTAARSAIDFDAWHWFAYGFRHTTGTNGFAELQIDGDLVYREDGIRTSGDGTSWYPKLGWYRWGSISGIDISYISGWTLHDSRPAYPGGGGEPTPTPGVSILVPASPGQVFIGELPYQVEVTQAPNGSVLYVGTAPGGIEAPATFPAAVAEGDSVVSNTLDLTNAAEAGQNDTLYAALHNSGGTMLALDTEQVTLFPPSEPPPPSGPVPVALAVESDTQVTISAQLLDPDVIVPEDRIEWAQFDLPREYEVRRAREKGTGRWLRYDGGLGGHVYDPTADSPLD